MTPADLERLGGLVLPRLAPPIGTFLPAVETGGLLYVSGQAPLDEAGRPMTGKACRLPPGEVEARAHRLALALLASVAQEPGRIARLGRCVKLLAMVNASDCPGAFRLIAPCLATLARLCGPVAGLSVVVLPALPNDITLEAEAVFSLR